MSAALLALCLVLFGAPITEDSPAWDCHAMGNLRCDAAAHAPMGHER